MGDPSTLAGKTSFAPGIRPSSPRWLGVDGGGHGPGTSEGWPRPSTLPEGPPRLRSLLQAKRLAWKPSGKGSWGSPGPHPGQPSPLSARLLGRRLAGSPICLLPQLLPPSCRDLPGRERRVPGSNPDAGWAPACSSRGQSRRGRFLGLRPPARGPGLVVGALPGPCPECRPHASLTLTLLSGALLLINPHHRTILPALPWADLLLGGHPSQGSGRGLSWDVTLPQ